MITESEIKPSWVYSMADYCQMFDLQESDLSLSLLDFPAGISSFNAQMHQQGYQVCSGDPLYRHSLDKVKSVSQKILEVNRAYLNSHQDILSADLSVDAIFSEWEKRLSLFIEDFELGKKENRYQFMELPKLPFELHEFDIALCSDHLFHSQEAQVENQEALIQELSRVAKEVRVFPLLNANGEVAQTLGEVMLNLQQKDFGVEIREVSYHQMKGGNAMLRIWSTKCEIES